MSENEGTRDGWQELEKRDEKALCSGAKGTMSLGWMECAEVKGRGEGKLKESVRESFSFLAWR